MMEYGSLTGGLKYMGHRQEARLTVDVPPAQRYGTTANEAQELHQ